MGLQGDQRALLQLLCERGQSYEDIAGLLGGSADEVRERARLTLTEIGGADPDADVALTDYLLGQADPIGRADAIRHLQGDPEALELARRIQAEIAEIAPDARQPTLPEPRGKRRRAALPDATGPSVPAAAPSSDPAEDAAQNRRRAVIAGLGALGVILVFVILAVAGVFSGGDSESDTSASAATTTAQDDNLARVPLRPVGNSGVAGEAVFGAVDGQQIYVDVDLDGLDPNLAEDKLYLLWLMVGGSGGYPVQAPLDPNQNGSFSGRLAVPSAIAQTVGRQAQTVRVSETAISEVRAAARKAIKQQVPIVPFTGDELASGDIPLVTGGRGGQGGGGGG